MAGEVKIPGMGNVDKKYVIWGVVVAVGIAGVVYVRAKKAAGAAAAPAGGIVTDPAGNQCAAVDPGSGYCPGTAEDQAYYAQQGSLSSMASGGYGGNYGGGYGPPGDGGGLSYPPVPVPGGGGPVTNSDWMTAALAVLPGDESSNQAALAAVLAGLTVTTDQKNIFLEAVALEGQPPQGYPSPIRTSDTPGQPGPGTQGKVKVPETKGDTAGQAHNVLTNAGLHPMADQGQKATDIVTSTNPKAGAMVNPGSTVVITARPPQHKKA